VGKNQEKLQSMKEDCECEQCDCNPCQCEDWILKNDYAGQTEYEEKE
tara:strand:+ start:473 stop:613 length:141 start_codon:yes stop_codon:yes gene_type:complete